jgi:hypothetical protein
MRMSRSRPGFLLLLGMLGGLARPGHANLLVALDLPDLTGRNSDIVLLDPAVGTMPVPNGINTAAEERHPSLSPDGRYLVFLRPGASIQERRIIMVDLQTGRQADLFTGLEMLADHPVDPSFSLDGQWVVTGQEAFPPEVGRKYPPVTFTNVSTFPTGPFAKVRFPDTPLVFPELPQCHQIEGASAHPVATGGPDSYFAWSEDTLVLCAASIHVEALDDSVQRRGLARDPSASIFLRHPAIHMANGSPDLLVVESHRRNTSDLVVSSVPYSGRRTLPVLRTGALSDGRLPSFTSDGRYLAYLSRARDGNDHLLVWDSLTQTTVAEDDLGGPPSRGLNVSVVNRPVVLGFRIKTTILGRSLEAAFALSTKAGILVQRITGRQRLLGRRMPKLKTVGPVPLGQFAAGDHSIPWDGRVNGRRLRPGRYQVTLRALSDEDPPRIRDLGTPVSLRIRH